MVNCNRMVLALAALTTVGACNVSSTAPQSTGGVDAGAVDSGAVAASDAGDAGTALACDRGAVVLMTDYMSTQVALTKQDGTPLSTSFVSTASTKASGVAFALSGDVVLPNVRPPSGRVVLLDRYGTNVVTWLDPGTAKVLAQLPVGTGFESNPQDYVELDATRAYVTRFGTNAAPGKQPFDDGNDVLVVDTLKPAIVGNITMPKTGGLPPRPSGMLRVGDVVMVVLQNLSDDFMTQGEGVLVGVKGGAVGWQLPLFGMKGCGRPALSPSGATIAIACEGQLDMNGGVVDPTAAAILVLDAKASPPTLVTKLSVSDQLGSPPQGQVAWASDTFLVGKTQTPLGGTTDNQLFALDRGTGKATVLLTAGKNAMGKGLGLAYGDVRCVPGCGDVCLLADTSTGKLRRFAIAGSALANGDVVVDPTVGLPPVSLGGF